MNRSALKKTFSPIAYAAPLSINRNLVYAFKGWIKVHGFN